MCFTSERGKRVAQKSSLKVDSWGEVRTLLSKRYLSSEVLLASVCLTRQWGELDQCQPRKIGTA